MAPSKTYEVSYPNGGATVRMTIEDEQIRLAEDGDKREQDKICMKYKRLAKYHRELPVWWNTLKQNMKVVATDPARAARQQLHSQLFHSDDEFPDVGEGGCGCECFTCATVGVHCREPSTGCKVPTR